MPHEKRSTEARRESRRWFVHSHFGARNFRRISAYEMKHCLLRIERANGRQHAERIASKENHICRMSRDARNETVTDEVDGVSASGVFRDGCVRVVDRVIVFEHNIIENRTKTQSGEDVRLRLGR